MSDFDLPNERESSLEADILIRAKRRGWLCVKLMKCGINSMPDRILHRRGYTMYMEIKKLGELATPQQMKRHRDIRSYGIPVHVVDNREAAYVLLD